MWEWLAILVKQMLEPDYALAVLLFQKFRATSVNSDHIGFFNFCVRVIGKGRCDGQVFNAYFTIAFYKHLLAVGVGLSGNSFDQAIN
ncbi:Chro.30149-like protein [Phakopsora pachyrhizi]|uniref:Chro.30149-like protein n=1 Tax=Phakopsora pachyrhizi TaxID=170000 RepID=A0AAV0B133_PHAPC|nr:Chro.30149-like protein [Phakopsora pachyrhizi]